MNSIPYVHYSKDKNSLLKTYFIALITIELLIKSTTFLEEL